MEASPERIKYFGLCTETEVASILANSVAAVVAVTNLRGRADTGLAPIKLFEAMATGTPVIVTDLPFQREIVRESQCGIVVEASDPAALARGVSQLFRNPDEAKRMGAAGRQAVLQTFSWRTAAEKTSTLLESVISARRAKKRDMAF